MKDKNTGIMKLIFTLGFLLLGNCILLAQNHTSSSYFTQRNHSQPYQKKINFNGQWHGGFKETSASYPGSYRTDYVLELTTEGNRVYGYSYTYFREGDKKYYTICRLTGSVNRSTKEIVVTEIERTKYNTPPDFQNCFQTHRLHYEKSEDNREILKGTWVPAPNQSGNCGNGITVLARRVMTQNPFGIKPKKKNEDVAKVAPKIIHPKKPAIKTPHKPTPPAIKKSTPTKPPTVIKESPEKEKQILKPDLKNNTPTMPNKKLESRRKDIVKTISIEQPTFKLDFYDNGEIDGDSISVFYNGKLVLSNQRLTDKPISINLELDKNTHENIVTMYADNLGTLPPNTAVMIVTDGSERYVVRITSDTEKSGSVVFKSAK